MFMDAMNILLLLEKLEPAFQKHMSEERKHVLWAITRIQACIRGFNQRSKYGKRRDCATTIQKVWRGGETRRKLLGALNQYNWRKKQVSNSVLERNQDESLEAKELGALESRIRITTKDQDMTLAKLRQDLGITLDESSEVHGNSNDTHLPSPANTVKSRIHQIKKESLKLRRLLSIDDDEL